MGTVQESYDGWTERKERLAARAAQGWRLLHDDYTRPPTLQAHEDGAVVQVEPAGVLTFADTPTDPDPAAARAARRARIRELRAKGIGALTAQERAELLDLMAQEVGG